MPVPNTKRELDLVERYQKNPYVHSLTCGNRAEETHPAREGEWDFGVLVGEIGPDGAVRLACRDCEYRQEISDHLWQIIRTGADFEGCSGMGAYLEVYAAQGIPDDHWLREPEWKWLLQGLQYAATQTQAIAALSKCSPGEAAHLVLAVLHGAGLRTPGERVPQRLREAVRNAIPAYCGDALDDSEVDQIVDAATLPQAD